ncbi:MAG: 1-acyl-sn-glycerol-3-phosphate acyltransferase [Pirellulaceae bacterium]|jgi:1-acyl-sn-glycerol-3-phosphate acyltransferase|nr:1-acyl-sn-glycerol-3-phosphate acyltransferase [Pirellulaceae bacterium]
MHPVVVDKPYKFVPPHLGTWWPRFLQLFTRRHLRRYYGIVAVRCQGLERLRDSLVAGHGILLTPNHCRPCDPHVVGEMCRQAGAAPLIMASWHLFLQGRWRAFLLRRMGAFSIYREGMDRQALQTAVQVLTQGKRPLIIFPEGVISRTNDRLVALMEGTSFVARSAAKKRAEASRTGQMVVHPVAIRYFFHGDLERTIHAVLDDIERRLSWQPQTGCDLYDRIYKVGEALLCLKEMEYLGQAQSGPVFERLQRLIDHVLVPLEQEWLQGHREKTVVARVKKLRIAILPDMVQGSITNQERERRWRQLADMYLVQQMSHYPADYIKSQPTPERILETVERFEEDLTDVCRIHAPMTAKVQVGEAIPVSPARDRRDTEDSLMAAVEASLRSMLQELATARP